MAAQEGRRVRARVEFAVLPFSDVDLNEFALKDNGKGKNGHNAFPLVNGEGIRFNLTPTGWLKTPFGFDVDGKYEKPSFLGGNAPEKANASEGLSLRVNLQPEQAVFLKKLDEISKTAFAELVDAKWNPLVVEKLFVQDRRRLEGRRPHEDHDRHRQDGRPRPGMELSRGLPRQLPQLQVRRGQDEREGQEALERRRQSGARLGGDAARSATHRSTR
jgi:hypothetical protein